MTASRLRLHGAALFGYFCIAVVFAWPLTAHLGSALPGDPSGDTGVYVWNLWVFQHELLVHHRFPFLTREILTLDPQAIPLTLHNYTSFANLLALPLIGLFGTVASFNILTIASGVLTAYAMFLYALRRAGDAAAAFVGGLLFGFNPFITARTTAHFSLVQAAPLPIFGLLMLCIFQRPEWRYAAAAGVVVAWAFLCDPYYAVYCLLILLFMVGYSLVAVERRPVAVTRIWWPRVLDLLLLCLAGLMVGIVVRGGGRMEILGLRISMTRLYTPMFVFSVLLAIRLVVALRPRITWRLPFSRAHIRAAAIAGGACAVALAPVLYAMASPMAGQPWQGPRVLWRSSAPGVDALAWLTPNPFHPMWGSVWGHWLAALPNGIEENVASIPWIALATIGIAVVTTGIRHATGWWVFTALFAWLSLGPFVHIAGLNTYIPTPWALLRYLPVIGAARMPTRLTVLVMLGVSMLLALALATLRARTTRPRLLVVVVALFLACELLPAPRPIFSAAVPEVYRIIAADPRPVRVLNLPFGVKDGLTERGAISARAQYFQTVHEKPLVGGYLSRLPPGAMGRYRRNVVVRVLLRLSEGTPVDPELMREAEAAAPQFIERMQLGFVVIDAGLCAPELIDFARRAFSLVPVAVDGTFELYRTELGYNNQ